MCIQSIAFESEIIFFFNKWKNYKGLNVSYSTEKNDKKFNCLRVGAVLCVGSVILIIFHHTPT